MLKIIIPGDPIAWKRAGVFSRGRKPFFFDSQTNEKAVMKQYFMHALTNYQDGDSSLGRAYFSAEAYNVFITFYFAPPKSMSTKELNLLSWNLLPMRKKPDLDNGCKIILDVGNKILWDDDAQIVSLYSKKLFCKDGKPRTEIEIMPKLKDSNVTKILCETPLQELSMFCADVSILQKMVHQTQLESDDQNIGVSLAYMLSKIAHDHGHILKKLDKHKHLWHELNAEVPVSGEGKILC